MKKYIKVEDEHSEEAMKAMFAAAAEEKGQGEEEDLLQKLEKTTKKAGEERKGRWTLQGRWTFQPNDYKAVETRVWADIVDDKSDKEEEEDNDADGRHGCQDIEGQGDSEDAKPDILADKKLKTGKNRATEKTQKYISVQDSDMKHDMSIKRSQHNEEFRIKKGELEKVQEIQVAQIEAQKQNVHVKQESMVDKLNSEKAEIISYQLKRCSPRSISTS
jgi:hypothetical protein